ncbi:hypothetical protein RLOC_00006254 [Lonchura striata]|uniref:Uncharacterized protein n=1 Tax=Lonchura striata TaxID=40157 RepID=A0A218UGP8_9PASE|nr:hypothetical protein RLOC_00006254 [Lonchura striata domestica]
MMRPRGLGWAGGPGKRRHGGGHGARAGQPGLTAGRSGRTEAAGPPGHRSAPGRGPQRWHVCESLSRRILFLLEARRSRGRRGGCWVCRGSLGRDPCAVPDPRGGNRAGLALPEPLGQWRWFFSTQMETGG